MFICEHQAPGCLQPQHPPLLVVIPGDRSNAAYGILISIKIFNGHLPPRAAVRREAQHRPARAPTHARVCVRRCALESPGAVPDHLITAKDILNQI